MFKYFTPLFKVYYSHYSGLPYACWHRIFLCFIVTGATGVSFFLSLYFVDSLHIDLKLVGVLLTCYGLGTICGGALGGKLSEKTSPKIVSVSSLLVAMLCYILMIIIKDTIFFMGVLFTMGFVANSFRTINNVKALDYVDANQKLKAINIVAIAYNLGLALSGVLISFLGKYGFKNVFIGSSLALLGSLIYLILVERKSSFDLKSCRTNQAEENKENTKKSKKIFLTALGCLLVFGFFVAQLTTTYPIYIYGQYSWLGLKSYGYLFILNPILVILFQAPIGNSFKRNQNTLIMGLGIFLFALGFFALNFLFSIYALAIISCIIYTFGEILFYPRAQLIIYEHASHDKKASILGVFQTVYSMGLVAGPAIGTFIYASLGASLLWHLCGFIGAACLGACFYSGKKQIN